MLARLKRINFIARVDERLLSGVLIAMCILSYVLLFGHFRVDEYDDSAEIAFYYNAYVHHIFEDVAFSETPKPRFTMAAQTVFNGWVMSRVGWTKAAIHVINLGWMALASIAWWLLGRKFLEGRKGAALLFVVLLFGTEAMMGAAYKGRPDALTFLLESLAVLAYVSGWPLPAGFLLIAAFETHPIGLIGAFYMAAVELHRALATRRVAPAVRNMALGAVGVALGVGYYFWLHPVTPGALIEFLRNDAGPGINPLYAHFFQRAGLRFLPELAITLGAFAIALGKRRTLATRLPFTIFCVLTASSFLILRGNFHYATFYYPAFALLIVDVAFEIGWQKYLMAGAALYFAAYYGALLYHNRGIDEPYLQRSYMEMAAKVPDHVLVLAPPGAWFAFKEKDYRYYRRAPWLEAYRGKAYLILNDAQPPLPEFLACMPEPEEWKSLDRFTYLGANIELYAVELRGCRQPVGASRIQGRRT